MHEYTLDEEELKICPEVHDYFALYKVFKKSGPGPKNGEQYGAPFREEDWADEDCLDTSGLFAHEGVVNKGKEIVPFNNEESEAQVQHPAIDLEEFMNQIEDDPVLAQSPDVNYQYELEQILSEQEFHSTLVKSFSTEVSYVEQINMPHPISKNYDVRASFDITQSDISQLHCEAPEVISTSSTDRLQPHAIEEDFLEDFLEVDDLVGLQSTDQDVDYVNPENFQLEDLDGLCELDLIQDVTRFLNESGFDDQIQNSQSLDGPSNLYTNHLEVGLTN